jgi:hypothetical protein
MSVQDCAVLVGYQSQDHQPISTLIGTGVACYRVIDEPLITLYCSESQTSSPYSDCFRHTIPPPPYLHCLTARDIRP